MQVFPFEHKVSAAAELIGFIKADRFATHLIKQIGQELHHRLVEWPVESEVEYSRDHPVSALFVWLDRDGIGLDPEWLKREDGTYADDQGKPIPSTVKPQYTPAEQMAAYGLWLVYEHAYQWGKSQYFEPAEWDKHLEQYGVTAAEAAEHVYACLLFGYQAALYAYRLERGQSPTELESEPFARVNFAMLGAKGGRAKAEKMKKLEKWAISRYTSLSWKSANHAAHSLADEITAYGRTINAELSPSNAQRTIAEWFRRHNKCPSSR